MPEHVNYKTIQLSRGKHSSPLHGACVMELASMIAGEPFSDHPQSVCEVIGAVLRAYNDSIDDRRRQDLYACAADVIGTDATAAVRQARIERCLEWAREVRRSQSPLRRILRPVSLGPHAAEPAQRAAQTVVRAVGRHSDETHAKVLALIEELCAIGARPELGPGRLERGSKLFPAGSTGAHQHCR